MPFKDFTVGQVLTSTEVDEYLMRQSVMTFSGTAERGTALGTAVLVEGMVSYLEDSDTMSVYDGTAWQQIYPVAGDISAVTAGYGLTGGGTSGSVTIGLATAITSSTATAYTLGTVDAGATLRFTNAATITVSTATDFPIGQQVQIFNDGTALAITTDGATIAGGGTSITSGTLTVGSRYGAISIFCVDTDNYRVIGNVS